MATFVLVHGGWAGGWQWREVASLLRSAGHVVFTPTLTGLGERVHLANPEIGLDTHVQDIANVLTYEDLHKVVLVGYSYSGMVITGVAERIPERLSHLVYVEAFVPEDGQSLGDLIGPDLSTAFEASAQTYGEGWRVPHHPPDTDRRTDHPLKTMNQPLTLSNPAAQKLPRAFVFCTQDYRDLGPLAAPIAQAAAKARAAGWRYFELPTGHMPMQTMPHELVTILLDIAQGQS